MHSEGQRRAKEGGHGHPWDQRAEGHPGVIDEGAALMPSVVCVCVCLCVCVCV